MLWMAGVSVTLIVAIRALDPRLTLHWWSFSRSKATLYLLATSALLAAVSAVGVIGFSRVPSTDSLSEVEQFFGAVAAASIAHASLRRTPSTPGSPNTSTSDVGPGLVLGALPAVTAWISELVLVDIESHVHQQQDDAVLLRWSAELEAMGAPVRRTFDARCSRLDDIQACLDAGGSAETQARADLRDFIIAAYVDRQARRRK